jgi:oxygen-independent coproporphyrinogen-3 oxidase
MPNPIRHVYVHVPFCHRICPYCSFFKHQPGATDTAAFLESLTTEAAGRAAELGDRLQVETIYFGGGTPSMLSSAHLERFLPGFLRALGNPIVREWTFEMNPRSLTEEKLALLRTHGVTRASLGVQAWDEPTLRTLGRDHGPEEAEECFAALRRAHFPVVSIDLMFSVPGQSLEAWLESMDRSLALRPDHLSCYNLTYEEDTPFFERFQRGDYQRDEATDEAFFTEAMRRTAADGMEHYEISNYARPGCESLHNCGYWSGNDYVGLGPGAVSTIDRVRSRNIADTPAYMAAARHGRNTVAERESLTDEQWRCERIALELRTRSGVALAWLGAARRVVPDLIAAGLAEIVPNSDRLILTTQGKLVADSVVEHIWSAA